jgi:hypothetical protein
MKALCFGLLLSLALALHTQAQVQVDRTVELTGATSQDKQVIGLPLDSASNAALTAGVEQRGSYRYAAPAADAVWQLELPALTNTPQAGTQLMVKVPEGATGSVAVSVNGSTPYAVELLPDAPLDAASLPAGYMLSLVFDGEAFQVVNGGDHALRTCPNGMAAVNDQFCIERQLRGLTEFATAVNACAALGRRLCTWGEFIAGCQRRTDLNITTSSSDWEWTNSSANEANSVRTMKMTNCAQGSTRLMGTASPYRCCMSR